MDGNDLLGGCLHSPSDFLVWFLLIIHWKTKKPPIIINKLDLHASFRFLNLYFISADFMTANLFIAQMWRCLWPFILQIFSGLRFSFGLTRAIYLQCFLNVLFWLVYQSFRLRIGLFQSLNSQWKPFAWLLRFPGPHCDSCALAANLGSTFFVHTKITCITVFHPSFSLFSPHAHP